MTAFSATESVTRVCPSATSLVEWIFLGLLVIAMCVDALLATIVVRVRVGNFWNNTVLAHLLRLICRLLREIGRGFRSVFRNLPIVWKPVLGFLAFVLLGMLFTVWFRYSWSIIALLCWILLYVAAFILVLRSAVQLSQLKKAEKSWRRAILTTKPIPATCSGNSRNTAKISTASVSEWRAP